MQEDMKDLKKTEQYSYVLKDQEVQMYPFVLNPDFTSEASWDLWNWWIPIPNQVLLNLHFQPVNLRRLY